MNMMTSSGVTGQMTDIWKRLENAMCSGKCLQGKNKILDSPACYVIPNAGV